MSPLNPRLFLPLVIRLAAPVVAVARTLYFNAAVDEDWASLGNWFSDAECTAQATSLPTAIDSVVALAPITSNSGAAQAIVNFSTTDTPLWISITATGMATFYGDAYILGGVTVTGNATFNDSSFIDQGGTVTGNATFNSNSYNGGTVGGTATFNDGATNCGGTANAYVPNPPPSCE